MTDAIKAWAGVALAVVLAGVLGLGYWLGWSARDHRADKQEVRAAAAVVKTVEKQDAITAKVGAQHEEARERIRVVTRTITKEVPRYVTPEAVSRCDVPLGFVRLHDAAASGSLPDAPSQSDADPSGVGLDRVAGTVVENYGACHEVRAQLLDLQAWVREQQALSGPKLRH